MLYYNKIVVTIFSFSLDCVSVSGKKEWETGNENQDIIYDTASQGVDKFSFQEKIVTRISFQSILF